MTQKEFEQRTGLEVSAEYFEEIHKAYMEAGDYVDKDTFCEEWKKNPENRIVQGMHNTIRVMNVKLDVATERIKEQEQLESGLVDFLLERAQKFGDEELLIKTIELVGHAEVIRRKLVADMPLWERDREYIKKNLK